MSKNNSPISSKGQGRSVGVGEGRFTSVGVSSISSVGVGVFSGGSVDVGSIGGVLVDVGSRVGSLVGVGVGTICISSISLKEAWLRSLHQCSPGNSKQRNPRCPAGISLRTITFAEGGTSLWKTTEVPAL